MEGPLANFLSILNILYKETIYFPNEMVRGKIEALSRRRKEIWKIQEINERARIFIDYLVIKCSKTFRICQV